MMKTSLRSLALVAPFAFALVACGNGGAPSDTPPPEQLEALAVTGEAQYEEVTHQGTLTITGAERDFSVNVAEAAGAAKIGVHTPGMSDLSTLTGRAATVKLANAGLHEERSIIITDEAGPLYVADVGHGVDSEAMFGKGFVTWGDPVATNSDDLYDWEYTPAVFKTDKGEVSVLPGDTATIEVGGSSYRVAVIAAYRVTPHPDAALPCGGISDLLSYELLRVDAKPEPVKITRPTNAKLAHLGCMADD